MITIISTRRLRELEARLERIDEDITHECMNRQKNAESTKEFIQRVSDDIDAATMRIAALEEYRRDQTKKLRG